MTLQEAIKSGRPFKRPEFNFWIVIIDDLTVSTSGDFVMLSVSAILATDWIIQDEFEWKETI
jgi:hypothetical protein